MSIHQNVKRVTTHVLSAMKLKGEKITMLTGYDYSMARILDNAGIEVIPFGDSASNVMAGYETTLSVTLNEMINYASSVVRGTKRAPVIVDLPFGSYQGNSKEAPVSAVRIMKETGADAVKFEGGSEIGELITRILSAGIPVMGHLGLIPQSINKFGTYAVRAQDETEAQKLMEDARLPEKLGCFGIVLEKIPASLAGKAARELKIPVIVIGAGPQVDGQVPVLHDMPGLNNEFSLRFLRRCLNLYEEITGAVRQYIHDVRTGNFPNEKEQY